MANLLMTLIAEATEKLGSDGIRIGLTAMSLHAEKSGRPSGESKKGKQWLGTRAGSQTHTGSVLE